MTTITDAATEWLHARSHLSAATRSSYRGEVDRMGQFFAAEFGVLDVGAVTEHHWKNYLSAMISSRDAIANRRTGSLLPSSAAQARRIGAQFLIWCAQRGLIGWWPMRNAYSAATPVPREVAPSSPTLPPIVSLALTGNVSARTLEEARSLFAINLSYWGSLDPALLTVLKVRSISPSQELTTLSLGERELCLPKHVGQLWQTYRHLRHESSGEAVLMDAPLIARLDAEASIRPWSIWALVKDWQIANGVSQPMSPRELRRLFLLSIGSAEQLTLGAATSHAGLAQRIVHSTSEDYRIQISRLQSQQLKSLINV